MEGRSYSIFTSMWHPEYQNLKFYGSKKWDLASYRYKNFTDEIGFRVSLKLNREARKNLNKIDLTKYSGTHHFFDTWGVSRVPAQTYPMVPGMEIMAYGYSK